MSSKYRFDFLCGVLCFAVFVCNIRSVDAAPTAPVVSPSQIKKEATKYPLTSPVPPSAEVLKAGAAKKACENALSGYKTARPCGEMVDFERVGNEWNKWCKDLKSNTRAQKCEEWVSSAVEEGSDINWDVFSKWCSYEGLNNNDVIRKNCEDLSNSLYILAVIDLEDFERVLQMKTRGCREAVESTRSTFGKLVADFYRTERYLCLNCPSYRYPEGPSENQCAKWKK